MNRNDHCFAIKHLNTFIFSGIIVGNNESLIQHGVKPREIVQLEIFSTHPDQYPVRRVEGLSEGSKIITVTIQTGESSAVSADSISERPYVELSFSVLVFFSSGTDRYEEVAVEIVKSDFHKPFLGGFRHKITGVEYHNAGTQTVPKKIREKPFLFCRDTQVMFLLSSLCG